MQKAKKSAHRSLRNFSVLSAAAVAGLVATKSAHAETSLTWAPAGSTTGIQEGVWDTTTSGTWYNNPTYQAYGTATTGTTAVFNANGAFVTSDGTNIYVDDLITAGTYTSINGTNAITLSNGGTNPATIAAGNSDNLFINAPLASSNLVTLASQHGANQLFLSGNDDFTGGLQLTGVQYNSTTVVLNSNNAINAGATLTAYGLGTYSIFFNNNINAGNFQINAGADYAQIGNYSGSNTFAGTYTSTASTVIAAQSGLLNLTATNALVLNNGATNYNLSSPSAVSSTSELTTAIGTLELSGANAFAGTVTWQSGVFELGGAGGAISGSTSLIIKQASFLIDNTLGSNGGRFNSAAAFNFTNSNFTDLGNSTAYTGETTSGTLTLTGFQNWNMTAGAGNGLSFTGAIKRTAGANMIVTAASLGDGAYTSGYNNILGTTGWSSTTNEVGGGGSGATSQTLSILPWVTVVDSNNTGLTAGSFATYGANGLTALTTSQYNTNFSGIGAGTAGANTNERVTTSTTLGAAQSINSLLLDSTGGIVNLGSTPGSGPILTLGNLSNSTYGWGGIIANGAANAINNGTLTVNGTHATNDLIITTIGNLNIGAQIINNPGGTGLGVTGITKGGNGTLTLSNANTFTGSVYLNQGILDVAASGALGGTSATSSSISVASDATLEVTGGVTDTDSYASVSFSDTLGGSFGYSSTGTPVYSEGPIVNGNLGAIYGDGSSNTLGAALNFINYLGGGTLINVAQGGTLTLTDVAPISGTSAQHEAFQKVGAGTLDITNASFGYTGNSSVAISIDNGTLAFTGQYGGIGNTVTASAVNVNPDATLLLDNTAYNNNSRLSATETTVNLYKGTFQIDGNASTSTAQTVHSVILGGESIINVVPGTSAGATLTMTTFTPGSFGAIIEGNNLGSVATPAAGDATIVTGTSQTALIFGGGGGLGTTTTSIYKTLIGDTNDAGVGNTFLTYDTAGSHGFVPLSLSTNYYLANGTGTISAGATASATNNIYVTAANDPGATGKTINSLNINTNSVATIGGTAFSANILTDTSTVLLASGNGSTVVNQFIGASNIWVTGNSSGTPGTLTLANESSAGTNSTIDKYGIGTLILTDNNSKTTATNIYGGTVLAEPLGNSGSGGPTGGATTSVTVYGGGTIGGNTTIFSSIATSTIGTTGVTAAPYFYAGAIAPGTPSNSNPYTAGANGTGTAATLTVQNNVYLAAGSFLDYVLNTPTGATAGNGGTNGNSFLKITGQNGTSGGILEMGTNETVVVTNTGSFGPGVYQLASYGTLEDQSQAFRAWNVVTSSSVAANNYIYSFSTALTPNTLDLVVGVAPSISLTAAVQPGEAQITNGTAGTAETPVGVYSPTGAATNTLTTTYTGTGYLPGFIHGLNTASGSTTGIASGYTQTAGFNTTTENEVFLMKLDVNGTVATSLQDSTIVGDINEYAQSGLTASIPTGAQATLGGTVWSIELTFADPGLNAGGNLGFNFSGYVDGTISNVTATDVAAVPEPTALGLIGGGALMGMLTRRSSRRRKSGKAS